MYIYHDKIKDEYLAANNLARLSEATGINYDNLKHWFSREKLERVAQDDWVVVKTEPIKRKGAN